MGLDPKLAFVQYQEDIWCYKTYGHSYTVYIETLIDKLVEQCDHSQSHEANIATNIVRKRGTYPDCRPRPNIIFTPSPEQLPTIKFRFHLHWS